MSMADIKGWVAQGGPFTLMFWASAGQVLRLLLTRQALSWRERVAALVAAPIAGGLLGAMLPALGLTYGTGVGVSFALGMFAREILAAAELLAGRFAVDPLGTARTLAANRAGLAGAMVAPSGPTSPPATPDPGPPAPDPATEPEPALAVAGGGVNRRSGGEG